MKILGCIGSYRTHGNTARVLSLIEEQMRREAERVGETLDFETVYLGHLNMQMCRGCRICFDRGEEHCPRKDDLLTLKARMKEADGIIAATPVYVDDVSGITKNWIDRLAHACHRPEFAGKCAYLLATTGSSPTKHALRTLNGLMYMGYSIIGGTGFKTGALSTRDEINSRYGVKIDQIARTMFRAIHQKVAQRPSFYSLMVFKIQQMAYQMREPSSVDYRYWKGNGWLDPQQTFYTEHHSSRLKVSFARLVGAAIAPFIN
jgi:multimeric flavodoxin WrbA